MLRPRHRASTGLKCWFSLGEGAAFEECAQRSYGTRQGLPQNDRRNDCSAARVTDLTRTLHWVRVIFAVRSNAIKTGGYGRLEVVTYFTLGDEGHRIRYLWTVRLCRCGRSYAVSATWSRRFLGITRESLMSVSGRAQNYATVWWIPVGLGMTTGIAVDWTGSRFSPG